MTINISDVFKIEGMSIPVRCEFVPNQEIGAEVSALSLDGLITNFAGRVEFEAQVSYDLSYQCDRCLKDSLRSYEFQISERLSDTPHEDAVFVENGAFDLIPLLTEELCLNLPTKLLCSEDCRGLCGECGADLNMGSCRCGEDRINPAFEKLNELLKGEVKDYGSS